MIQLSVTKSNCKSRLIDTNDEIGSYVYLAVDQRPSGRNKLVILESPIPHGDIVRLKSLGDDEDDPHEKYLGEYLVLSRRSILNYQHDSVIKLTKLMDVYYEDITRRVII